MKTDLNAVRGSVVKDAVGNPLPTALAMHDLSCFGKCALSIVLPTLSASGVQAVPIPTALLSTQTDGFENYYFEALTSQMSSIARHLKSVNVSLQAIYTGFLGSDEQIDKVCEIIELFNKNEGGESPLLLIDPVMGDHGKLYSTYTPELMLGMRRLCKKADVITPNITEACFLTDSEYVDTRRMSKDEVFLYASEISKKLQRYGVNGIAITGLHYDENKIATYAFSKDEGEFLFGSEYIKQSYPGTGDLFASVLLGRLLKGGRFNEAVETASNFTKKVIRYSSQYDYPIRNGVVFEPFLSELAN